MNDLVRNFRPIVETYVQEEKPDPTLTTSPKDDDYFLSRLDLTGKTASALAFTSEPHGKNSDSKLPKDAGSLRCQRIRAGVISRSRPLRPPELQL